MDRHTGKKVYPLSQALNWLPYRQYQPGALEPAIGLAMHLSYRQASGEGQRIQGHGPSKSTVHRGVQELAIKRWGRCSFNSKSPGLRQRRRLEVIIPSNKGQGDNLLF
jgi:hypothetical protein